MLLLIQWTLFIGKKSMCLLCVTHGGVLFALVVAQAGRTDILIDKKTVS